MGRYGVASSRAPANGPSPQILRMIAIPETCRWTVPDACYRPTVVGWLFAAALLLMRGEVAAQQIIPVDGGRVSVAAEGVPLETLLRSFGEFVDLRVSLQPGVGERTVTVNLEPSPIVHALHHVLQVAGVDFVLSEGAANQPIRLTVGEWRGSNVPGSDRPAVVAHVPAEPPTGEPVPDGPAPNEEPEHPEPDASRGADAAPAPGPVMPAGISPAQRLVHLLAPARRPNARRGTLIALPFPGPDGQPQTVPYDPPPPGIARVPFPDANGNPLEFVVPPSTPGIITLPFPGPDGRPATVVVPLARPARPDGSL